MAVVTMGSAVLPQSPTTIDLAHIVAPPTLHHPLGTDELGRDVLVRLLFGGRISLSVSALASFGALVVGLPYGCIAGFFGGRVDGVMMRVIDFLLSMPSLVILLILGSFAPESVMSLIVYISLFSWMGVARLVRGQVLSLRERDFVTAARALGGGPAHLIVRHVVPHLTGPLAVATALGVADAMVLEATLDFLGLGVSPDVPTWGNMITAAQPLAEADPLLILAPGFIISITVISVYLIADGLRDITGPTGAGLQPGRLFRPSALPAPKSPRTCIGSR